MRLAEFLMKENVNSIVRTWSCDVRYMNLILVSVQICEEKKFDCICVIRHGSILFIGQENEW